jgi:hypothetical protein
MGGSGGVAAHQHLRCLVVVGVGPPPRRQGGQCLRQDDDVVTGGIGAGVAGAQHPGQGFPAGDLRAVQKRQQRMKTEGLLPGRGSPGFVVGVVDHQGGVDVDVQPAITGGGGSGLPGCRPRSGPCGPHPREVRGIDALIDQPPHCGRRRLRAEDMLTVTAQLADPVNAIRPISHRGRQIGEHLPGRVHPRAAVGVRQRGGDLRR